MYLIDDSQLDSHLMCTASPSTYMSIRNGWTIVHFWYLKTLHREAMWQLCQGTAFPLSTPTAVVAGFPTWQAMAMVRLQQHYWMGDQFQNLPYISTHDTGLIIVLAFRVHQMLNFTPWCQISGTQSGSSVLQCLFSVFMCTFK
jgi:hypothetical protein